MDSTVGPSIGYLVALGLGGLIPVLLGLVLGYFVIRLAVRHALRDAARDGEAARRSDRR